MPLTKRRCCLTARLVPYYHCVLILEPLVLIQRPFIRRDLVTEAALYGKPFDSIGY